MAAPVIFRSTDGSAPALNGNAGSLVNVLDWCLISGGSASNLGWTIAYTGTNARDYRPPAGVQHYLDVDDNGPDGTALGRNARCRGYTAMTALATGTGPFPTVAQQATPVGIVKSTATGTTARPWILIGDDRGFLFFCESGGTDPPTLSSHVWTSFFCFGEIESALTGDLYRTLIALQSGTTTVVTAGLGALLAPAAAGINTAVASPLYMPRSFSGSGAAIWAGWVANAMVAVTGTAGGNSFQVDGGGTIVYPNPTDGGLYMNAVDVGERGSGTNVAATTTIRGRARGLIQQIHGTTVGDDQTTFSGVAGTEWAGRTFIFLKTTNGGVVVETTAWPTSS